MSDKVKRAYKQSKGIYDDVLTQSKWWSRLYIRFFWGVDDIEITNKLFQMLPDDFAGQLLDVPCGTLNLTVDHYHSLEQSRITCLDYSGDMLAGAKERIANNGLSHATAMHGDVGSLPFGDETFDAVLSMNGFHVFPSKARAYAETARVLKKGGLFFGCFYVQGECKRSDFIVNAVLARRGWFSPPFLTKDEVAAVLRRYYDDVTVYSKNAMLWFRCVK